jgi:hypothetical protein
LGKKDNEESIWNIPFYIHPTTGLYSQKYILGKRTMRNLFGIFLSTLTQQLVCILKMHFGKRTMRNLFGIFLSTLTQQLVCILKKAFIKKGKMKNLFGNIPCLEDEEDSKLKFIPSYQCCSYSSLNGGLKWRTKILQSSELN